MVLVEGIPMSSRYLYDVWYLEDGAGYLSLIGGLLKGWEENFSGRARTTGRIAVYPESPSLPSHIA